MSQNVRASLINFPGILRAFLDRTLSSLPMLIFAVNVIIIYQVITGNMETRKRMSMKIKLK